MRVLLTLAIAGLAALSTAHAQSGRVVPNDTGDGDARRVRINATAELELPGGTVRVIHPLLPADGPDASAIDSLGDGEVLQLTRGMALKLQTEVDLRFGADAVARAGNVAAGYPGVYSLWLRRSSGGWSLVLNSEPDIWGTMRDPQADAGETTLEHRLDDAAAAPVLAASMTRTNGGGQLAIAWGPHRWIASFDAGAHAEAAP